MIVIVIIGVVYALVITKLENSTGEQEKVSLKTLKSFMLKQIKDQKSAKLVCKDDCTTCKLFVDGQEVSTLEDLIDDSIEVYRYNYSQGLIPQELQECFVFNVGRDRVSDQLIVVFNGKVYDFTQYFKDVQVYDSLNEFISEKEQLIQEVR